MQNAGEARPLEHAAARAGNATPTDAVLASRDLTKERRRADAPRRGTASRQPDARAPVHGVVIRAPAAFSFHSGARRLNPRAGGRVRTCSKEENHVQE
jgi:hypothetical protein